MAPLLKFRPLAWLFLAVMAALTVGAMGLAAVRSVPLKMLPFDNKNELLLVLDFDEGTTLERSDAAVRDFESYLATVPEVVDYTSYVGLSSPMDFNGLVRHYYLRQRRQRRGSCGSTWPAKKIASCKAMPSACGCETSFRPLPTASCAYETGRDSAGTAGHRHGRRRDLWPAGQQL